MPDPDHDSRHDGQIPGVSDATGPADSVPDSQDLAALYVQAGAEGEDPDLEEWAARLDGPEEQDSFRRMVMDAQRVTSLLPRQVGAGVVLGGRYKIAEEIGAGGMGKVFSATDMHLDRPVAVKVLAAMGRSDFDPLELFRKESRLLASLRHPNIVDIHEAATDGDISYLVMELVHGPSIEQVLETVRDAAEPDAHGRRCAPQDGLAFAQAVGHSSTDSRTNLLDERSWWRTVTRVMVDLAGTLESTHDKGIVHRDIKPSNILLRPNGSPVVLDFGLAGFLEGGDGAVTRGFVGSAAYLAPEQVLRRAVGSDPCTDIYQLGLLLYEMLTLQRAFPEDNITELLPLISKGRFERPRELDPTIPSELEAICLKAMEFDPARRYSTARELREDLERYLGGHELPLAARGGTMADLARRGRYFARRHKGRMLATAAALLIVATGFITPQIFADPPGLQALEPYRFTPGTYKPIPAGSGDGVGQDDVIGVLVKTEQPVYLYVLSVFGQASQPNWIAPMEPRRILYGTVVSDAGLAERGVAAVAEGKRVWQMQGDELEDWALRIEAQEGGTYVACSVIEHVSQDVPYEGLWVIACSEPQPHLAQWMDQLNHRAQGVAGGAMAVPYEAARDLFASASTTRGSSPRLKADVDGTFISGSDVDAVFGDDWPFEESQRVVFLFKVDQALAGTAPGG